jgi:hypothetical protein
MTRQWIEAVAPEMIEGLFEDLLAEASEEEQASILFNLLQSCLSLATRGAETGQSDLQRDGVAGAVAIVCFLREHLRRDSVDVANGVLRRFYNAVHRQIIKAHRDEAVARFREIRISIAKVIQKPYSTSFYYNCMQESVMSKLDLKRLIRSPELSQAICRLDHTMHLFSGGAR